MKKKEVSIKRQLTGKIVKLSSTNTAKVEVERKFAHPLYEKILKTHKRYLVHVEDDMMKSLVIGDIVVIQEVKPVSKRKSFVLISKSGK